jgi:hypothetical protein
VDLTQVTKALYATADLMEQDETRTQRLYGSPVGIPVSMGDYLIREACYGPITDHRLEWVRIALDESLEAANAWSQRQAQLRSAVFGLVYPHGARSDAATAVDVRALADQLTASAG